MKKTNHERKQTPFRKVCEEKRLNEEELAEMLGVRPRTIYAYLIGERVPSLKVMKAMEEKMGINPLKLFTENNRGEEHERK